MEECCRPRREMNPRPPGLQSDGASNCATEAGNLCELSSHVFMVKSERYHQGPVVQSVVSLTSSLRVISLTVLADSIYNILIFFAEKM